MSTNKYMIYIQYDEYSSSYEVFQDVASLMLSIDELNNSIATSFGNDIETEAVISEISGGSIKIWLSDNLKKIPDNKIKAYVNNPKEAISDLLIKTKSKMIELLTEDTTSINMKASKILEEQIIDSGLSSYGYTLHKSKLLSALGSISKSANLFSTKPKIYIEGKDMTIQSNYKFDVEQIENITRQTHKTRQKFTIKKPDILGDSKWTIIFDKAIDVKILDMEFRQNIKERNISISHKDMLDADLTIETFIDEDMDIIETRYSIDKIYDVVPPSGTNQ